MELQHSLFFVGASLLANRRDEQASPQTGIRWQASSHYYKRPLEPSGFLPL